MCCYSGYMAKMGDALREGCKNNLLRCSEMLFEMNLSYPDQNKSTL